MASGYFFEWDPAKDAANRRKHGLPFSIAEVVFDDPMVLIVPDRHEAGEERWHAVGLADAVRLIVVVHAYPDPHDPGRVRVVSLRRATRMERALYDGKAGFDG